MTELVDTLRWVIERIESEADVVLEGGRPNWRRAAIECAEEAYGALSRFDSQNQFDAIAVIRGMPNGLLTPQAMADYLEFKKREIGHG